MITKALLALGLLLAAAGAGWSYGNNHGYASGYQAKADVDKTTLDTARESVQQANAALAEVQQKLDDARRNHRLAMQAAEQTIADRDARITALKKGLQFHLDEIRNVSKQWDKCEVLARQPVCRAVADKLWPASAASTQAAGD